LDFISKRLRKCVSKLEELVGNRISNQKIEESVQIYNKNRALLRQIYELRKMKPGILSAKEMSALVISSMVTPVEENNKFLSELISGLERVQPTVESDTRLILSGHLCHEVKDGILDLIETMGGVVVGDDLYTGLRYFASDVDPNTPLMEAFAHRYLNLTVPCPTRVDVKRDWAEFLIQSFREHKAKGIIMILAKNCEPHMIYYPYIKARLESAGIPHILIQVEYEMVSLEGIRTRIQAFIEMLRD
jgi:benzoyl-CoA reductase subunit C